MSKLLSFTLVVVNLSAVKIYILRLSRDQLRKMQLQGLRLGIVPNTTKIQRSRAQYATNPG